MHIRPWLSACVIAGSLAGLPVRAQPAPSPEPPRPPAAALPAPSAAGPTLAAALEAAWRRTVSARETDAQRRRAEADRVAAGSLWAAPPSLEMSVRDDRLWTDAGNREADLGVTIPLWLPGQRAARTGTAEASSQQALVAERAARLRLAGELRESAWQLAAVLAEASELDAHARTLARLADDVERRVRAGDLARADALAARGELLGVTALQADARQRVQSARARWRLLTGLNDLPDPGSTAFDAAPAGDVIHPELQLAGVSAELARRRVELVRLSRRDPPELSVGLRQEVPGRGESSQGSVIVGLRLPLATDDRNRPLEVAAIGELDVAEAHEQRLRERLEAEVDAARDARRAAEEGLEAERARAGVLRERAALIEKSFQAGESALPDLLRALDAAARADGAAARQTAALGLARARLQQALGLLP
jgi:outer membrane protein TolC